LQQFYLPNLLGYALLEEGLRRDLLRRDDDGRLRVAQVPDAIEVSCSPRVADAVDAFLRSHAVTAHYQTSELRMRDTALSIMNRRRDITRGSRILCLGDGEGLSICLQSPDTQVTAVDVDTDVLSWLGDHGVRGIRGDVRFMRGFHVGSHDVVTSYQIEGDHDDSVRATVIANLRPHGAYYTYFVGNENERFEFEQFLWSLERDFVITDCIAVGGAYVVRAVRYPELHAHLEFFAHVW
jgi:hypothetical protein